MKNITAGSSWAPGSGVELGQVQDIQVDNNGIVNVTGNFSVNHHIMKYDGTTWSPLGGGLDARGMSLSYDITRNIMWVGGDFLSVFATIGGTAIASTRLAGWDTVNNVWISVGPYLYELSPNKIIRAIAVQQTTGHIILGGDNSILFRYDGVGQWLPVIALLKAAIGSSRALLFDRHGTLFVGGEFNSIGYASDTEITANSIAFCGQINIATPVWQTLNHGFLKNGKRATIEGSSFHFPITDCRGNAPEG